jgi:HK97 family phage major capsid protein
MPTIKALEDQYRALNEDQKKLVLDDSRPWAQKRTEWENRDKDMAAVLEQANALKAVDSSPFGELGSSQHGAQASTARGALAGLLAEGARACPTPQLDLDVKDAKELHEAAVSHRSLSVSAWKNATDTTSITPAAIPDYRLPPVTMRREPTRVLSLVPLVATDHPSVTWYTTTGTSSAAAVAEGGTKPTSTLSYTAVTSTVTKLAHVAEVTDETIKDFPAFLGALQADMFAGLVLVENNEVLNATVTGAHKFAGLLNVSGILTRARTTEPYFDAIELGLEDLRNGSAYTDPDGLVMHPSTWGLLRRQKDDNGQYYIQPNVTQAHSPNVWGVPVVLTTQIASGTVLMGDFGGSTVGYVREGIRIDVANQGENQFKNNTSLVRAEERILVTVPRPTGLLKLTGIS